MKKIVCFLPFIIFLIIRFLVFYIEIGSVNISFYIVMIGFLVAGILLRYSNILGGIIGIFTSLYIYYTGTQNWKAGDIEIGISIILLIFYAASIVLIGKNKS